MFGSRKRRKEKNALAGKFNAMATDTGKEIDSLKAQNPFESASAKAAMTRASQGAKQMGTRILNTMGANASPEALIASQGAMNQATGAAAGAIASGAESNQNSQLNALYGKQAGELGQYAQARTSAIDERGSGWKDTFSAMETLSKVASSLGATGMSGGGAGGAEGAMASEGGGAALAALSDKRAKENIIKIGVLQGQQIYKFNYIGDKSTIIGVIAQEIPDEYVDKSGSLMKVYYDKLFKAL